MSSPGLDSAHAEWRAQVEVMREAIAKLKLPESIANGAVLEEYEEDDEEYGYSSGTGSHDVWDYISDSELDEISFDSEDALDGPDGLGTASHGVEWLTAKCFDVASRKGALSAEEYRGKILDILRSTRSEEEIQSSLADLVGFDDFDFITDLLSHRREVVDASATQAHGPETVGGHRLLRRSEREEALRRRDFEHKNATLASARSKEPEYPHVYRAYNPGNTLNHAGKRYALPGGSDRKEFEKYEEYTIPAGRTGTLRAGQKLVEISEMDGLCRRTFRGYKSLNRMQSLVFPVAYKTSENMLICAPTGAVSLEAEAPWRSLGR